MKRQSNPTIKAQLLRSALYVLLLLSVCVIPFALAQRNSVGQSNLRHRGGSSATKTKIVGTALAPSNTITVTNTNDSVKVVTNAEPM
jgi:hypothetical protein